jgi:hypothetical protein
LFAMSGTYLLAPGFGSPQVDILAHLTPPIGRS